MNDTAGKGGYRHRRSDLHIAATAEEVLVYSVWKGETLLTKQRGTIDHIKAIRANYEPLMDGLHATLGSGEAHDPIVAVGESPTADPIERVNRLTIANARALSDLTTKMARDNLQVLEFSRTLVADVTATVYRAREEARTEEAARWQALCQQMQAAHADAVKQIQANSERPLVSGDVVNQISTLFGQVSAFLRPTGEPGRGPGSGQGQTNG